MTQDASKRDPEAGKSDQSPVEGISQFIAKVLDQLSVSAWLPGVMLVGNAAVLLQLRHQENLDVGEAVARLTASTLGIIVVVFIAVVLTTMVAQAFAFEVIRLLEGYWGRTRLTYWLATLRTRRHYRRMFRLQDRKTKYLRRAFISTRETMLESGVKRSIIQIHEDRIYGRTRDPAHSEDDIREANAAEHDWLELCPPWLLRRVDALDQQLAQFPTPNRLLPTRLGNTLRAVEDLLSKQPGRDLEGMVMRNYDRISVNLRANHDQFRNRLDMYCMLVFVFVVLAALAPALLIRSAPFVPASLVLASSYAIMAWISYVAAVTSARGYGTVLRVIDNALVASRRDTDF